MSIQHDTRRQCLPLCFRFSTSREMAEFASLSHNQRHSTIRQCLSLYQPQLHTRWKCLPLWVILNITEDLPLWVIFNITQEGIAFFLSYIIQTAVFASVCPVQHHTRRLCWLFLFNFKIILSPIGIVPLGYQKKKKKRVKIKHIFHFFPMCCVQSTLFLVWHTQYHICTVIDQIR